MTTHWIPVSARILGRDLRALAFAATLRLLPALLVLAGGCAAFPTVAAKTISGAEMTLVSVKTGLVEFDKVHQEAIVDAATSKEEAKAKLAAYRKTRDAVTTAILTTQRLLVVAESALLLVTAGLADSSTVSGPLADLVAAVTKLVLSFTQMKVPSAPVSSWRFATPEETAMLGKAVLMLVPSYTHYTVDKTCSAKSPCATLGGL